MASEFVTLWVPWVYNSCRGVCSSTHGAQELLLAPRGPCPPEAYVEKRCGDVAGDGGWPDKMVQIGKKVRFQEDDLGHFEAFLGPYIFRCHHGIHDRLLYQLKMASERRSHWRGGVGCGSCVFFPWKKVEFLENPHGFVHVSMGQRTFNGEPTFQIRGFETDSWVPVPMGQTRSERPALALQASALEMQVWLWRAWRYVQSWWTFFYFSIFTKQPCFVFSTSFSHYFPNASHFPNAQSHGPDDVLRKASVGWPGASMKAWGPEISAAFAAGISVTTDGHQPSPAPARLDRPA